MDSGSLYVTSTGNGSCRDPEPRWGATCQLQHPCFLSFYFLSDFFEGDLECGEQFVGDIEGDEEKKPAVK